MYILEEENFFWLLLIIPVLFLLFMALQVWKRKRQKLFASPEMLRELSPDKSRFKPTVKFVILMLVFAGLTLALVNPKIGTKMETVTREGVDIVFAIDVSKSMEAEDIAPNRLEKSKQLVTQIINNLASDRIGIIAYAGSAFPQLPITTDYASAKMFLQAMNTDMISSQGTAISEAIDLSTTYFNYEDKTSKVLVILSDGEDHEGDVNEVAKKAASQGIQIYTVGVGSAKGGPIPIRKNGVIQNYKKDRDGETVITRLNEETLKELAYAGRGRYIQGNITKEVISTIKEELQGMDKTEFEAKQFADYKSQFQWFLGLAILLLLLDMFILERKTGWVKKLNLFNERRS